MRAAQILTGRKRSDQAEKGKRISTAIPRPIIAKHPQHGLWSRFTISLRGDKRHRIGAAAFPKRPIGCAMLPRRYANRRVRRAHRGNIPCKSRRYSTNKRHYARDNRHCHFRREHFRPCAVSARASWLTRRRADSGVRPRGFPRRDPARLPPRVCPAPPAPLSSPATGRRPPVAG